MKKRGKGKEREGREEAKSYHNNRIEVSPFKCSTCKEDAVTCSISVEIFSHTCQVSLSTANQEDFRLNVNFLE